MVKVHDFAVIFLPLLNMPLFVNNDEVFETR
jgi:hypothetical protein